MSTPTEIHNNPRDHRFVSGDVGARTTTGKFNHGDVCLWRNSEGKQFTLYMPLNDAYLLAEALDALLAYIEENPDAIKE